jgi:hypothetical protein
MVPPKRLSSHRARRGCSGIDARTTRHPGYYAVSQQNTSAGSPEKLVFKFTLTMAGHNLICLSKLVAANPTSET